MAAAAATTNLLKFTLTVVDPLLNNIFKSAKEINEITQRAKANQYQFVRINQRIKIIIKFLQERELKETINETMKMALEAFDKFLTECKQFMKKIEDAGFVKRLLKNKIYLRKFQDLHTEFSDHLVDLQFCMAFRMMLSDKNQDQYDQELNSIHMERFSNEQDINDNESNSTLEINEQMANEEKNIFLSGIWKYQHNRDEVWQDLLDFKLFFNQENKSLLGFGEDNSGRFILHGLYCKSAQIIKMTWSYENDTLDSNSQKNISLQWNDDKKIFESNEESQQYFKMALFTPSS